MFSTQHFARPAGAGRPLFLRRVVLLGLAFGGGGPSTCHARSAYTSLGAGSPNVYSEPSASTVAFDGGEHGGGGAVQGPDPTMIEEENFRHRTDNASVETSEIRETTSEILKDMKKDGKDAVAVRQIKNVQAVVGNIVDFIEGDARAKACAGVGLVGNGLVVLGGFVSSLGGPVAAAGIGLAVTAVQSLLKLFIKQKKAAPGPTPLSLEKFEESQSKVFEEIRRSTTTVVDEMNAMEKRFFQRSYQIKMGVLEKDTDSRKEEVDRAIQRRIETDSDGSGLQRAVDLIRNGDAPDLGQFLTVINSAFSEVETPGKATVGEWLTDLREIAGNFLDDGWGAIGRERVDKLMERLDDSGDAGDSYEKITNAGRNKREIVVVSKEAKEAFEKIFSIIETYYKDVARFVMLVQTVMGLLQNCPHVQEGGDWYGTYKHFLTGVFKKVVVDVTEEKFFGHILKQGSFAETFKKICIQEYYKAIYHVLDDGSERDEAGEKQRVQLFEKVKEHHKSGGFGKGSPSFHDAYPRLSKAEAARSWISFEKKHVMAKMLIQKFSDPSGNSSEYETKWANPPPCSRVGFVYPQCGYTNKLDTLFEGDRKALAKQPWLRKDRTAPQGQHRGSFQLNHRDSLKKRREWRRNDSSIHSFRETECFKMQQRLFTARKFFGCDEKITFACDPLFSELSEDREFEEGISKLLGAAAWHWNFSAGWLQCHGDEHDLSQLSVGYVSRRDRLKCHDFLRVNRFLSEKFKYEGFREFFLGNGDAWEYPQQQTLLKNQRLGKHNETLPAGWTEHKSGDHGRAFFTNAWNGFEAKHLGGAATANAEMAVEEGDWMEVVEEGDWTSVFKGKNGVVDEAEKKKTHPEPRCMICTLPRSYHSRQTKHQFTTSAAKPNALLSGVRITRNGVPALEWRWLEGTGLVPTGPRPQWSGDGWRILGKNVPGEDIPEAVKTVMNTYGRNAKKELLIMNPQWERPYSPPPSMNPLRGDNHGTFDLCFTDSDPQPGKCVSKEEPEDASYVCEQHDSKSGCKSETAKKSCEWEEWSRELV